MLHLTPAQLREVQMTERELLLEAHRVCENCGIPYLIIAGTLLGAVRHKGFIPWDDDVDIALLRPDYERFREACRTELDHSRFIFQDDRNTKGYRWGYGKLRRKDTLFLREHQEDMPYFQGIFMDVFPLDEVPAWYPRRLVWDVQCFLVRKLLWARVGKEADKNRLKRLLYAWMDRIPEEKILGLYHRLIRRSEKLTRQEDRAACAGSGLPSSGMAAEPSEKAGMSSAAAPSASGSTRPVSGKTGTSPAAVPSSSGKRDRWVRILMFPAPGHAAGYRRKWYEHRAVYTFEDAQVYGIRDADEYLSFKFGNYRELPPEKDRKTHPVSQLRLLRDAVPEEEGRHPEADS